MKGCCDMMVTVSIGLFISEQDLCICDVHVLALEFPCDFACVCMPVHAKLIKGRPLV